jgi:hypothetical protein
MSAGSLKPQKLDFSLLSSPAWKQLGSTPTVALSKEPCRRRRRRERHPKEVSVGKGFSYTGQKVGEEEEEVDLPPLFPLFPSRGKNPPIFPASTRSTEEEEKEDEEDEEEEEEEENAKSSWPQ